jgi:hypothetical protein
LSVVRIELALRNRVLGAVIDGLANRALELSGHITGIGDSPAVIGHLEDFGAQREAHAVAGAAVFVDDYFHETPTIIKYQPDS